jgi:hypothetical protein
MARVNVYLPDELARRARAAGLNVSDATRSATGVADAVVVDAAALLDLLAGTPHRPAVRARLEATAWHAPAHVDAEILSALGRLARATTWRRTPSASN